MSSGGGGALSFIRSFGRTLHNDLIRPTIEAPSGVDPEPQLEPIREGPSNTTHEKDASIERVSSPSFQCAFIETDYLCI
jgi:hypothetical protein